MCYLIAKKRNENGCYAFKTNHGKNLSDLKKYLSDVSLKNNVQLVTISRPSAYGEYSPYSFIDSKDEFLKIVENM